MDSKRTTSQQDTASGELRGMAALGIIGGELARARKARGISPGAVSAYLRLTPAQVKALEAGDASAFSSAVYIIGHVRSYAAMVGLDPAPICARLREPKKSPAVRNKPESAAGAHGAMADSRAEAGSVSDFIPAGLVHSRSSSGRMAIAALGIFALAYGGWYAWDTGLVGSGGGGDTVAPIAEIPAPALEIDTATTTAAIIPDSTNDNDGDNDGDDVATAPAPVVASVSVAPAETTEAAPSQAVAHNRDPASEITLRASAVSWVEITRADGSTVTSGLMRAGDEYVVPGDEDVYLTTGNAGGLEIEIRGADAKKLGASGETISEMPLDPALLSERY